MGIYIKEIRGTQVLIPVGIAGGNRIHVYCYLHLCGHKILFFRFCVYREVVELTIYVGNHKMADLEAEFTVIRVCCPLLFCHD